MSTRCQGLGRQAGYSHWWPRVLGNILGCNLQVDLTGKDSEPQREQWRVAQYLNVGLWARNAGSGFRCLTTSLPCVGCHQSSPCGSVHPTPPPERGPSPAVLCCSWGGSKMASEVVGSGIAVFVASAISLQNMLSHWKLYIFFFKEKV